MGGKRAENLSGRTFGELTVILRVPSHKSTNAGTLWLCHCSCGREVKIFRQKLVRRPRLCCNSSLGVHRGGRVTDDIAYGSWEHMRGRCYSLKDHKFEHYGGRGIGVCDRWRGRGGFRNFLEDMGPRPSLSHSIERRDVNGDYTPENCSWATLSEQNRNTRVTIYIDHDGDRVKFVDLMDGLGFDKSERQRIYGRVFQMGWSLDDALSIPIKRYKKKSPLTSIG